MDEEAQVALVQELVPGILRQYGIEPKSIENVNHAFNSSFKITDSQGQDLALRINLASHKSGDEVLAEMQWLEALSQDGSVHAPEPLRTTNGELVISTHFDPLNTETTAVLFKWIEGEEVGDEPTNEQIFELGENMARLQVFAKDLKLTGTAFLPKINSLRGLKLSDAVYTRLSKNQELLPIHADLHMGNVIQNNGKLAIIDFDDAGLGLPVQDLVISNYYMREDREKEKHLKAGYSSVLELPKVSDEDYEVLLLGRLIVLINAVLDMTSAEIIEFLPTFLTRAQKRFDHFYATGEFSLAD